MTISCGIFSISVYLFNIFYLIPIHKFTAKNILNIRDGMRYVWTFLNLLKLTIFNFCNNFTWYWGMGILFETKYNIYMENCSKNFFFWFCERLLAKREVLPFFPCKLEIFIFLHITLWPTKMWCWMLQSPSKYCDTTPFFLKKMLTAPYLSYSILRGWKLFRIALIAAWYIWQV